MLRKSIAGAKYYSDELHQMTNLNIAKPADNNDINFGESDMLLAKDIIKLTGNAGTGDIDEIKTQLDTLNKKVEQNSGSIATLDSKFTGLFEVVNTLPNINDAQLGKIYCVKDTSSTDTENKYTEWVKIKNTDSTYKFEKVGEFNATPDLSGYAKLSGASFRGSVTVNSALYIASIGKANTGYLHCADIANRSDSLAYVSSGKLANIGIEESFVFTLEDGSKVTKSIRVVSTTNS